MFRMPRSSDKSRFQKRIFKRFSHRRRSWRSSSNMDSSDSIVSESFSKNTCQSLMNSEEITGDTTDSSVPNESDTTLDSSGNIACDTTDSSVPEKSGTTLDSTTNSENIACCTINASVSKELDPENTACYTIDTSASNELDTTLPNSTNSEMIVSLSDAESDSSLEIVETKDCIDLTELDDTVETIDDAGDISIIAIIDSTRVRPQCVNHFRLDTAPDFIPVEAVNKKKRNRRKMKKKFANVPNNGNSSNPEKRQKLLSPPKNQMQPPNNGHIITKAPTRLIQLSYPNILNDNAAEPPRTGLRPIIIDGANIGYEYGNGDFVMHGLILVIQYFKNRGHSEIVCFLPKKYRHAVKSPSEERTLCSLEKENIFSYTPTRKLENGKNYTPYDDRFILQYATERQGVIISNDGYRDLINEEPSWRETIEKRIVNFTFARDIFMLPKDPHGPSGPTLDEILKFPEN